MAHHNSTPQRILDAPILRPVLVWAPRAEIPLTRRELMRLRRPKPRRVGAYVGNVRRDLLGEERRVSKSRSLGKKGGRA